MKRFTILVLFVSLVTLSAFGRKHTPVDPTDSTGVGLQKACSTGLDLNYIHPRLVKTHREAFDLGYCLGIIRGVYQNLNSEEDFCITNGGSSIRKVAELVVSFVQAHPDLKDEDAADIVRWALADGYPCHPTESNIDSHISTEQR